MTQEPLPLGEKGQRWVKSGKAAALRQYVDWMKANPNIVADQYAVDLFLVQLDQATKPQETPTNA